jgi:hypothetical protein
VRPPRDAPRPIVSTIEALRARAIVRGRCETIVVVPAVRQSRLQWLTNDEDRARETAARAAERLAEATPGETIEARAGDSDPILAIEDALREFDADEILVVTRPDDQAGWLESNANAAGPAEVSGVPVRRAVLDADGSVETR